MVSKEKVKSQKKNFFFFLLFFILGKMDIVLEKRWLFSIGNGAEIQPLEMGRKSPEDSLVRPCLHNLWFVTSYLEVLELGR